MVERKTRFFKKDLSETGFFLFLLQDIRDAFPDVSILSVSIEHNDGRFKASAKLLLDNPELLDDWPESRSNVFVKNKEVSGAQGDKDPILRSRVTTPAM
jgi:hypothetical protein